MMIFIELVAITVMITLAWRVAISEGMIFEKLGYFFEDKVDQGHKIYDLFQCPWCANTLSIFPAHAFAFGLGILPFEFTWRLLIRWPLIVFASCFISGFIWTVYLTLNAVKEKHEAEGEYFKNVNYERENFDKEQGYEVHSN